MLGRRNRVRKPIDSGHRARAAKRTDLRCLSAPTPPPNSVPATRSTEHCPTAARPPKRTQRAQIGTIDPAGCGMTGSILVARSTSTRSAIERGRMGGDGGAVDRHGLLAPRRTTSSWEIIRRGRARISSGRAVRDAVGRPLSGQRLELEQREWLGFDRIERSAGLLPTWGKT